jgi:hypothetical protein
MSVGGLRGLLKAAFNDPQLEELRKAPGADPMAVAAAAGFTITAEEFSNAFEG